MKVSSGSFFCSGRLIITLANAGAVINVFMAILIGSFSLALLAPEMQGEQIISTSLFSCSNG
jgi:ATP-binding cassette subfamily B (MDR/TAP) protein 1